METPGFHILPNVNVVHAKTFFITLKISSPATHFQLLAIGVITVTTDEKEPLN